MTTFGYAGPLLGSKMAKTHELPGVLPSGPPPGNRPVTKIINIGVLVDNVYHVYNCIMHHI